MATTLTISALSDYVREHADELLVKATVGGKSLEYAEIMTNVAFKDALIYLDSEVNLKDGADCSFDPDGSDVLAERYIEVHPVKVNKSWCAKDLRKKIFGLGIQWEAGRISLPVEQYFAESNMNRIADAVEDMVWQGNSAAGVTGWLADAAAEDAVIDVTFSEGQTATAKVEAMIAAIPMVALRKGVNVFLSYTDFRSYVAEQNASCCANRPIIDANADSIAYVGDSRISLVPVAGLEGTGKMVAAAKDNLVYGTNIEGSENVYKMFQDEKTDETLFKVEFLAGTAIKFPGELVLGA